MAPSRVLLMAILLLVPVSAGQGPPGDRDVRTTKDAFTGDTLTTLTLMLAGPSGSLPINMSITAIQKAKPGAGPAVAYRLDFDLPMYTGAIDYKSPQVAFELDGSAGPSYDVDQRITPPTATHITVAAFAGSDLSKLARAGTIRGKFFGVEFVLTPEQVRAIREFSAR